MMAAIDEAGLVSQTLPVRDTLFFKIQGDPAAIESTARTVQQIVAGHGSSNFMFAQTDEEAEELWADRKNGFYSGLALKPGAKALGTDVW